MCNVLLQFKITLAYLIFLALTGLLAVFFNMVEIYLIRKSWKTITNFDLVLLNLAIADAMTGLLTLVKVGISIYVYLTGSTNASILCTSSLVMVLPFVSSTFFVIIIGIERLMAIKRPLQHRYRASSRRTTLRIVIGTWVLTIAITITNLLIGILLLKDIKDIRSDSAKPTLIFPIFMSVGMFLTIVLYAWMASILLRRKTWLPNLSSNISNKNTFRSTMSKEKAAVIVCVQVVVSYIICNLPFIVDMFYGKLKSHDVILVCFNSVMNPLIYFFKGQTERYCTRQKLKTTISGPKRQENKGIQASSKGQNRKRGPQQIVARSAKLEEQNTEKERSQKQIDSEFSMESFKGYRIEKHVIEDKIDSGRCNGGFEDNGVQTALVLQAHKDGNEDIQGNKETIDFTRIRVGCEQENEERQSRGKFNNRDI